MWIKPWTIKEGFLLGGGIIVAGLALELSVGPVVWDAFAWPANGIVLAGFLIMIAIMSALKKKVYAFQYIGTYQAAIPAMVYAVILTIIMGLTRQQVGGTWLNDMLSFWPFVLIYIFIALILGAVAAGILGFLIGLPTLRLKGDYLAIATLGLGEIIRIVIMNIDYV